MEAENTGVINIGNISLYQIVKNSPLSIVFTHVNTRFLSFHIELLNLYELATPSGKTSSQTTSICKVHLEAVRI